MTKTSNGQKIRINTSISEQPAQILLELKRRGLVTSNTDAVIQGLLALYEKVVARDLKVAQLKTLKESEV